MLTCDPLTRGPWSLQIPGDGERTVGAGAGGGAGGPCFTGTELPFGKMESSGDGGGGGGQPHNCMNVFSAAELCA